MVFRVASDEAAAKAAAARPAAVVILEFYEGRGWEALGYGSWREPVVSEFQQCQSHLYELLNAAKVERNISAIAENNGKPIWESVLRPLAGLEPEEQRVAKRRTSHINRSQWRCWLLPPKPCGEFRKISH
jgi:hypothetical protein